MSTDVKQGDRFVGFVDNHMTFVHVTRTGRVSPTLRNGYRLEIFTWRGKRVVIHTWDEMMSYLLKIQARPRPWSIEQVMDSAPPGTMTFDFT